MKKLLVLLFLYLPVNSFADDLIFLTYIDCDRVSGFFIAEQRILKDIQNYGDEHELDSRYHRQYKRGYQGECLISERNNRNITWDYYGQYIDISVDGKLWIKDINITHIKNILIKTFENKLELNIETGDEEGDLHIAKKLPIDRDYIKNHPGTILYNETFVKE